MPTVVDGDAIRTRLTELAMALFTLAISNVMEKPEVQAKVLAVMEAQTEATVDAVLISIQEAQAQVPVTAP